MNLVSCASRHHSGSAARFAARLRQVGSNPHLFFSYLRDAWPRREVAIPLNYFVCEFVTWNREIWTVASRSLNFNLNILKQLLAGVARNRSTRGIAQSNQLMPAGCIS